MNWIGQLTWALGAMLVAMWWLAVAGLHVLATLAWLVVGATYGGLVVLVRVVEAVTTTELRVEEALQASAARSLVPQHGQTGHRTRQNSRSRRQEPRKRPERPTSQGLVRGGRSSLLVTYPKLSSGTSSPSSGPDED